MKWVVVFSDSATETGQWVVGPFPDEYEAEGYAKKASAERGWNYWWIDELTSPEAFALLTN